MPATINSSDEAELCGKIAQKISGTNEVNLSPTLVWAPEDFVHVTGETWLLYLDWKQRWRRMP